MSINKNRIYKKNLGQHFLLNIHILRLMCEKIQKDDYILEIGSGDGRLTDEILLKNPKILVVIEKDPEFCKILALKYNSYQNLILIPKDIKEVLDEEIISLFQNNKFKIVSNIPYCISSYLISRFIKNTNYIEDITFMVQKEFAERITDKNKNSRISILCSLFSIPEKLKIVKRSNFYPQPNVDSAIIYFKIVKHEELILIFSRLEAFLQFIKTIFTFKRKTLRKTFKILKLDFNKKLLSYKYIGYRAEDIPSIMDIIDLFNLTYETIDVTV